MLVGIVKETQKDETRVAATPETVAQYVKLGFEVSVEKNAGLNAFFEDKAYETAGAKVVQKAEVIWQQADIILKINAPDKEEMGWMKEGATLVSTIAPGQNEKLLTEFAQKKVNVLAIDALPRISRAQKMDILSSMANIAGYRSVIEAANNFGRFFTGQITAAGKVEPAKVMVIGAGVAGLAAIGTAVSLGAIVNAFDTRPEVKDQVESMGASFLELDFEEEAGSGDGYAKVMSKEFIEAEMKLFAEQAEEVDIIITTAMIPGKPAPKLILKEAVDLMKRGSVIVDMAAGSGGNCELSEADKIVETDNGVKIIGYTNYASRMPAQSSRLFSNNLLQLVKELSPEKDGKININMEDDVIRGVTVVKEGDVTWPPPPIKVSAAAPPQSVEETPVAEVVPKKKNKFLSNLIALLVVGLLGWFGTVAPTEFLSHLTVFVLACFVGYQVIWNVSAALHTPLMSVTNAISGIIVLGALVQVGSNWELSTILSLVAILIATINVVGGFVVTQRMLNMFRKDQ